MIITEKSVVAKPFRQAEEPPCGLPVRAVAVNPVRNSGGNPGSKNWIPDQVRNDQMCKVISGAAHQ